MSLTSVELESLSPRAILEYACERHDRVRLSFSGAEDVVLVDLCARAGLPVSVFTLDTGRLHPETLAFVEQVREHYGLDIDVYSPEAPAVEALVAAKGLFSFRSDGHQECCGIRKVAPLRRALARADAWITGQRRDQSPTRVELTVVQPDPAFAGPGRSLTKYNPLAGWTRERVWGYILGNDVPHNPLHSRGFSSIGCAPCTRATLPGEHERAGRWWWEEATRRECGLHAVNLDAPETGAATADG